MRWAGWAGRPTSVGVGEGRSTPLGPSPSTVASAHVLVLTDEFDLPLSKRNQCLATNQTRNWRAKERSSLQATAEATTPQISARTVCPVGPGPGVVRSRGSVGGSLVTFVPRLWIGVDPNVRSHGRTVRTRVVRGTHGHRPERRCRSPWQRPTFLSELTPLCVRHVHTGVVFWSRMMCQNFGRSEDVHVSEFR